MEIHIIGKTKDTHDDVFHCNNQGSWLEGCVHDNGINIWAVNSVRKGDFKRMMNEVTARFEDNRITFTMVISERLKHSLKGFTEKEVYWDKCDDYMTVLEGIWNNGSKN